MHPSLRNPLSLLVLLLVGGTAMWFAGVPRAPSPKTVPEGTPPIVEVQDAGGRALQVPLSAGLDAHGVISALPLAMPSEPFATNDPDLRIVANASEPMPRRFEASGRFLAHPLQPSALAETLAFLRSPVPDEFSAAERERALRNSVLNHLRAYPEHASALVPALAAQAADITQDPGLRDYALQHLATWAPVLASADQERVVSALQSALRDRSGTYAGTALLGLNDLAKSGVSVASFDVVAQARGLALDDGADILSRLTALALLVEAGVSNDDSLTDLARAWGEPHSAIPEGARRVAEAYLKLHPQPSLH